MQYPFFYFADYNPGEKEICLDEENSRHAITVLRMKKGDKLNLTNGRGTVLVAEIVDDHKKRCNVVIQSSVKTEQSPREITVAISLLKNTSRLEWFLEKATELGINSIIPMMCERTEKQKVRLDRMKQILISAMLQSRQCWMPDLLEVTSFDEVVSAARQQQKFIAHCLPEQKRQLSDLVNESLSSQVILIGPEGDFTTQEIGKAISHHFDVVSLGDTRLRSETAGIVASAILKLS